MEVGGQLVEILLPLCGFQELNLGYQSWQQGLLLPGSPLVSVFWLCYKITIDFWGPEELYF